MFTVTCAISCKDCGDAAGLMKAEVSQPIMPAA
jgi:hypothetical protein